MMMKARRLNRLNKLALQSVMATLEAGLPEFDKWALEDLKEDMKVLMSDTIESHVSGFMD